MLNTHQSIPASPGVYALIHRASGVIYVADTTNLRKRRMVWRTDIKKGRGSRKVAGLPDHPLDQWEFKIIRAFEAGAPDAAEMSALVDATVEKAKRQGLTPVGRSASRPEKRSWDQRAHALSLMPVPILDSAGERMTYAEAADRTGRSLQAVKEAAKRIRRRASAAPVNHISLDEIETITRPTTKR